DQGEFFQPGLAEQSRLGSNPARAFNPSVTTAESTHSKEDGKDAGGADPETGAVPFPQQKAKGASGALNVGGTTKYCKAMLSSHELFPWGESISHPLGSIPFRNLSLYYHKELSSWQNRNPAPCPASWNCCRTSRCSL